MNDEVHGLLSESDHKSELVPSIMPSDSVKGIVNNSTYKINLIRMSILWSSATFCFYMMQMFNKYIGGGIFYNFTLDQVSMIIGVVLGTYLYDKLHLRMAQIIALIITLVCGELIFALEAKFISPDIPY
jgi:hypothetical protein